MTTTTLPYASGPGVRPPAKLTWRMVLLGGLSLSIGWGIRGNFGHEYGAMIAGALAALAVVLVAGREDWWRRAAFFAFFGALGWSFGGTMSYMQVVAYTHSGHLQSQAYGFACLFVIGFLWAAMGGVGTAAPACLSRERLTELIPPIIAVFIAWAFQDVVTWWMQTDKGDFRHEDFLYWRDTDWVAALLAVEAALIYAAARGRFCLGTSLVLHCGIGWWVGFYVLVHVFKIYMTPPRGDNWAGALGMTLGLFVFCIRHRLWGMLLAGLISGVIGGLGFASAEGLKLLGIWTGRETNWHSVLEQSYGFINGVGIAVAMGVLALRTPKLSEVSETTGVAGDGVPGSESDQRAQGALVRGLKFIVAALGVLIATAGALAAIAGLAGMLYHVGLHKSLRPELTGLHEYVEVFLGEPTKEKFALVLGVHLIGLAVLTIGRSIIRAMRPCRKAIGVADGRPFRRWTEGFCVGLVMVGVTYVNLVKNVETWVDGKAMPPTMYGLHAYWWFSLGYLALLVGFVVLAVAHLRRPLAVIPERPLGKGQLLYLAFLWVMAIGNLMRAIPPFHEQRLITEGVIIINAIVCSVLILLLSDIVRAAPGLQRPGYAGMLGKTLLIGALAFLVSLGAEMGIARACHGDQQAPGASRHIRFGPNATTQPKPKPGQPHP
ncbi:MAG: hypothetical protein JXQ73_10575 [Phycisphaerae bacterium]|nr:hypothetical protein [Phycisphaerae bacterium]